MAKAKTKAKSTKKTSKAAPLREMDMNELNHRTAELQKEMFDLRQNLTTKDLPDTSQVKKKRRDYARLLTVMAQKHAKDGKKTEAPAKVEKKAAPAKKATAKKVAKKAPAEPKKKADAKKAEPKKTEKKPKAAAK